MPCPASELTLKCTACRTLIGYFVSATFGGGGGQWQARTGQRAQIDGQLVPCASVHPRAGGIRSSSRGWRTAVHRTQGSPSGGGAGDISPALACVSCHGRTWLPRHKECMAGCDGSCQKMMSTKRMGRGPAGSPRARRPKQSQGRLWRGRSGHSLKDSRGSKSGREGRGHVNPHQKTRNLGHTRCPPTLCRSGVGVAAVPSWIGGQKSQIGEAQCKQAPCSPPLRRQRTTGHHLGACAGRRHWFWPAVKHARAVVLTAALPCPPPPRALGSVCVGGGRGGGAKRSQTPTTASPAKGGGGHSLGQPAAPPREGEGKGTPVSPRRTTAHGREQDNGASRVARAHDP